MSIPGKNFSNSGMDETKHASEVSSDGKQNDSGFTIGSRSVIDSVIGVLKMIESESPNLTGNCTEESRPF
jgi:hypothetical protein